MLSAKTMELVDFAVQAGFDEERVLELFDRYVSLHVSGNMDELEADLELHGSQFMEFIQGDFCGSASNHQFANFNKDPQSQARGGSSKVEMAEDIVLDDDVNFSSRMDGLDLVEHDPLSEEHVHSMQERAMMVATAEECEMSDLSFALWKIFDIAEFRPSQEEIVLSILAGHDTFVLMPTGGGKSLCYQLPAVMSEGLTVVVSPLLSLVQDQVQKLVTLRNGGVPATCLSSTQTVIEKKAVYKEIAKDEMTCKLLYVTPEQLTCNLSLIEILQKQQRLGNFQRIVIDEAHCVSMWGHDFRPAYADLGRAKTELFEGIQTVALTATANTRVKDDILRSLSMTSVQEFQMSFYRSNLKFIVVEKTSFHAGLVMLEQFVQTWPPATSGIVYCLSKKECEDVAEYLNGRDISSAHYHAGLSSAERKTIQNHWMNGTVSVVVATIAFGMGIDNAHVRYVVHFAMPKSLENYYQEAGRAGRDGLPSQCVLFFSNRDVGRLKLLIRRGHADYKKGYELIEQVKDYCTNNMDCKHHLILEYLDERMDPPSCTSNCHVCVSKNGPQLTEQCPWSIVRQSDIAIAKSQAH